MISKIDIIDASTKECIVKQAIDENPKAVKDYNDGQKASLNFLVGQVMRLTRGKADPGGYRRYLHADALSQKHHLPPHTALQGQR